MLGGLKYLVVDPPPLFVFEIGEQAVVGVRRNPRSYKVEARASREIPAGVIEAAPGKPNIQQTEEFEHIVQGVLGDLGPAPRSDAALILPDASSRLTVLELDHLPGDGKEQLQLIRWKLKKTVPFDVDFARIAYQASSGPNGPAVMVAVTSQEVIRQYEAPFEQLGLWPGFVSLSTAAALNLLPEGPLSLFAKLAGKALTMVAVDGGVVRMVRCVDLPPGTRPGSPQALEDILSDLYPTFVFIGDNLGSPVSRLFLCGFGETLSPALRRFPGELKCEVEPLSSSEGLIDGREAGIWGYLTSN